MNINDFVEEVIAQLNAVEFQVHSIEIFMQIDEKFHVCCDDDKVCSSITVKIEPKVY